MTSRVWPCFSQVPPPRSSRVQRFQLTVGTRRWVDQEFFQKPWAIPPRRAETRPLGWKSQSLLPQTRQPPVVCPQSASPNRQFHLAINPSKPTPSRFLLWHPVGFNYLPRSAREADRSKVNIPGSCMTNISLHLYLGIGWQRSRQRLTSRTNGIHPKGLPSHMYLCEQQVFTSGIGADILAE